MIWVDRQDAFDAMMDRVAAQPIVALDTEADSLHSYFDKVCLIQLSIPDEDFVVDPLSKLDLGRFGAMLANPAITKVLHGGDYDVRILNRDFGFTIENLIDTMISAQLLGYEAFGLAALLERHFGVKVNKTHQRADWAMRPLTPEMLDYAATDTRYLIALQQKLREELTALHRWAWAVEEFARLSSIRYKDKEADEDAPEAWRRLKNIGGLDRRALGVIRELHGWRDELARAADRPPFKIIGNDVLIEIAKTRPANMADLSKTKGLARFHLDRYGRELARRVRRVLELPEAELPDKSEPKPWIRDKALEVRVEKLKKVRDKIAADLKIEPGVLAPRHVLTAIATIEPKDVRELDQIPAMRDWQKAVLGTALLAAIAPQTKLF